MDDFGKPTDEVTNLILPLDAFVRSVRVNRSSPHAFFLGAGCSISSGVPSAEMCIWRWKQDIFATANPGLVEQLGDTSLASVRERIQTWLNAEGRFPKQGSSEEYSFYVEQCYPIGSDRRRFFQELAQAAQPYLGYDLLCLLAEAGLISHVWTTNFDGLTARAAATSALSVIEVGLDTTDRIVRPPARNELLCVALHGDYRYDALKNTDQEVQEQDAKLREALIENLSNTSLIVAGYAGRDMSIMAALAEAYSRPGTGRLYWCGRDGSEPSDEVLSLLQKARKAGRQAYYVPITGFDDLITRMAFHCLAGAPQKRAAEIAAKNSLSAARRAPFTLDVNDVQSVIKSNAFSIQCPTEVLQFEVDGLPGPGAWKQLKEAIRGHEIAAVLHRGKVLALGTVDDVWASFGTRIKGDVERTPISNKELSFENGMIVSLLTEGLVRSIAATRDVETDNRRRLWTPSFHERTFLGQRCRVHDAVLVYLRQYNGKQYVVLKPTIRVTDIEGQEVDEKLEREAKRALLVRQYNREFNSALDAWRKRLFPADRGEFEYPPKSGMPFRFIVRKSPAFAQVGSSSRSGGIRLQPEVSRHVVYSGMQYEEPSLLFSDQQGVSHVKDTHPIRGILQNRPYDFGLTTRRFAASVRIGVICPKPDESKLAVYLATLYRRARADSKQEYLLDYPGFGKAFGISLELPQPGDSEWMRCGEPSPETGKMKGALDLGRHIIESIDALRASSQPNVMVVYIPRRWEEWNGYRTETERFDLHRFVKAYCVQRGITTQFLREETLSKPYQCEVMWWLSLSFYVKAMRIPWLLDGLDKDTAFVGLGFSVDPGGQDRPIVLGCSHIYGADGLGLQYKLSKIEEPVWRQKNPYMSRDDARRLGEAIRQLFYESRARLPSRVVIHKRTPFLISERDGLREGLGGIDSIEMLEVTVDPALRYVASRLSGGRLVEDGYPVQRGTTVVLDDSRVLLWVHGSTSSLQPGRRYYQGKSRIPAPLAIIRHAGTSPLSMVATEILGLSKMNWNSFDMYAKLPATIQSSSEIADVGGLLERFGPASYDYRLFI